MLMEWRNNLITGLQWSDDIINREGKEQVAHQLAARVKDGEVIGAGSGSTVYRDFNDLYAVGHSTDNSLGEASGLDF